VTKRLFIFFVLLSTSHFAATPPKESSRALAPISLDGERLFEKQSWEPDKVLKRQIYFPTPGVWYIWLRATSLSNAQNILTYDLDGKQPLKEPRSLILIQGDMRSQWLCYTKDDQFRIEIYVDKIGMHTLSFTLKKGGVDIEKIALSLHHSSTIFQDSLHNDNDPGEGRLEFPLGKFESDGFQEAWKSPPLTNSGKTYYVDSSAGNDLSDGLSQKNAWRSFKNVNKKEFGPGEALLLRRDREWQESLSPKGNGSVEAPISIGAYGKGARPYINGKENDGLSLTDQSFWTIQDLKVTSQAQFEKGGISIIASENVKQPKGIKIFNCIAFDTGADGIHVGSPFQKGNGYDGVVVENCLSFCNASGGIVVGGGSDQNGSRNSVIRGCTAYSNIGGKRGGIFISCSQNGLIEHCRAFNNGEVNIWVWNSINITIRYCEAFRGRPPGDAAGIDIDSGSESCTLENCYSHENQGVAYLLMGDGQMPYRGFPSQSQYCVMRFCVGVGRSALTACSTFQHGKVYNNILIGNQAAAALLLTGWPIAPGGWGGGWPSDSEFTNNIIVGSDKTIPLKVEGNATNQKNYFENNLYWKNGGIQPLVKWSGNNTGTKFWEGKLENLSEADNYGTIEDFRKATGQELSGIYADPLFVSSYAGKIGRLPNENFRLRKISPAINSGKEIIFDESWIEARQKFLSETGAVAYGIPMALTRQNTGDYWGRKAQAKNGNSIGIENP